MASNAPSGMVKYTSRDFDSIMKDFWDLIPKLTELWNPSVYDASDSTKWNPDAISDPGVVLGIFLASVADMLGVNTDWLANEVFAPSVSQRKNAEKLFSLMGYTLGWYTAARTEVTFTNNTENSITLDFGFNGGNFCTVNAYTDITNQSRVITYNILPMTNTYGAAETRSKRQIVADGTNVFADTDIVHLAPGKTCTRVAVEGSLRSVTKSVEEIKKNNCVIKLPSQHIDTTAVWVKAKASLHDDTYLDTQWVQVSSPSEFIEPEPMFAVTYDNYSNAQLQISNYINQLENYSNNYLVIYWIECSGAIGCVNANVLSNFQPAKPNACDNAKYTTESGDISVSNLANTSEMPHTYTVTGKSPETAKEAYRNSRNYINTWDSLITLPDFTRFLTREAGIDCGTVLDCQKALEINLAIYKNTNLTDAQKSKMYITYHDFPESSDTYTQFKWDNILDIGFDPTDPNRFVFSTNFQRYTAMCFAIYNDFNESEYPDTTYTPVKKNTISTVKYASSSNDYDYAFIGYQPPMNIINSVIDDYRPLQAMSVELQFGFVRVFPWYVVGEIYPKTTVDKDKAKTIIANVKEKLALYFSPANRKLGQKPTVMEVVEVIESADSNIRYFDAGNLKFPVINWGELSKVGAQEHIDTYDIEYFNSISFARYQDLGANIGESRNNLRIAPDWVLD